MLTSSDLLQALRPAFIVYALAMASTGAALRFAPDDARQAAARTPAAAHWLERAPRIFADASASRQVAAVARAATPLRGGLRTQADTCAQAAAEALPAQTLATRGEWVASALAGLP